MAVGKMLRPGDQIGGYEIDDVLGMGGMAVVYKARQLSLDRPVALKVLSGHLARDPEFRARFRREGVLAAALEHPHIIPVYEAGEDDGTAFIAMRLVDGVTLADRIADRDLSGTTALRMLADIADALDTAHAAGLIHRDVKPQNILIANGDHAYLTDFGVAKGTETVGLTSTGQFVGSVNYASPEQIRGEALTARSDVYSLAVVAFHALSGKLPFARDTDAGVMHAHLTDPPPALADVVGEGVPREVEDAVVAGMAKDPASRAPTSKALVDGIADAFARYAPDRLSSTPAYGSQAKRVRPITPPAPAPTPPTATPVSDATAIEAARPLGAAPAEPAALGTQQTSRSEKPAGDAKASPIGALAAAAAAVVVVGGVVGAATAGGDDTAPAARPVATAGLLVPVPKGWDANATGAASTGATLKVSTLGVWKDGNLLVGGKPVANPRAPLVKSDAPGTPKVVRLDGTPALKYSGSVGGRSVDARVVLTDAGAVVARCDGPASSAAACSSALDRLKLGAGRAIDPQLDANVVEGVTAAMQTVGAKRAELYKGLGRKPLKKRAAAANGIGDAHVAAASTLADVPVSTLDADAVAGVVKALRAEGKAFHDLGSAAKKSKRSSYDRRRGVIDQSEHRLRLALADLAERGYAVAPPKKRKKA